MLNYSNDMLTLCKFSLCKFCFKKITFFIRNDKNNRVYATHLLPVINLINEFQWIALKVLLAKLITQTLKATQYLECVVKDCRSKSSVK